MNWPAELPQQFDGDGTYRETAPVLTTRTNMEQGPPRVRRRRTNDVYEVTGQMLVTREQLDFFRDWWLSAAAGGANLFVGTLDASSTPKTYQFKEEPVIGHVGANYFRIAMTLYVVPQ